PSSLQHQQGMLVSTQAWHPTRTRDQISSDRAFLFQFKSYFFSCNLISFPSLTTVTSIGPLAALRASRRLSISFTGLSSILSITSPTFRPIFSARDSGTTLPTISFSGSG